VERTFDPLPVDDLVAHSFAEIVADARPEPPLAGRTTIAIADRLSTVLEAADQLLLLDRGHLA
jgi:ABC-type transport system involved in Fe-S cluster assembly fused permease/ATPase subunit